MFTPSQLTELNHIFANPRTGDTPRSVLEWVITHFENRFVLTASFGGGGLVLAHLVSLIDRTIPIVFLDTGFHFPETVKFKREFAERYGLNVIDMQPLYDPGPLYQTDTDACCHIRKVEPMHRALRNADAWVSAVRRDQSSTRARVETLEYQDVDGRSVLKVYPLARWTRKDIWRYLGHHAVPYHPLLDRGYDSIGCWPCTRATVAGESERAGRWSGTGKTECGLHAFSRDENRSRVTDDYRERQENVP